MIPEQQVTILEHILQSVRKTNNLLKVLVALNLMIVDRGNEGIRIELRKLED